jgi:lipoprotein-anchoring transpeptidase ErfK/SrfK
MRSNGENRKGWTAKAKWAAAVVVMAAVSAVAQETQTRQVLVSIPDRKLAVLEDGDVVKIYPIAVGKPSTPSPAGEFMIVNRVTEPTYYHKGEVIPAGPVNPLGTRWMGLNLKGYGIHGTNVPRSIGKAASHGCIRMAKADLEEVFEMLRVGDSVLILAESDEQTAQVFGSTDTAVVAQAQAVTTTAGGQ